MKKFLGETVLLAAVSSLTLAVNPSLAGDLGGLDLNGFCRYRYGGNASSYLIRNQGASGWRCQVGNKQYTFSGNGSDMNAACKWQYRRSDALAQPRNWADPYSWRCYGQNRLIR